MLNRRKGRTLTKRTILKSYLLPSATASEEDGGGIIPEHVQAGDLPVYSVGECDKRHMALLSPPKETDKQGMVPTCGA